MRRTDIEGDLSETGPQVSDLRRHVAEVFAKSPTFAAMRANPPTGEQIAEFSGTPMPDNRPVSSPGANDGLWDWNLTSDEVCWSPGWKAMLGYQESEIGVNSNEWFDRVHPEDLILLSRALAAHLDDQGSHFEIEHRVLDRRGIYRWILCRGAVVRDSAGIATRLAGSFSEVTDARRPDPLTGLAILLQTGEAIA